MLFSFEIPEMDPQIKLRRDNNPLDLPALLRKVDKKSWSFDISMPMSVYLDAEVITIGHAQSLTSYSGFILRYHKVHRYLYEGFYNTQVNPCTHYYRCIKKHSMEWRDSNKEI